MGDALFAGEGGEGGGPPPPWGGPLYGEWDPVRLAPYPPLWDPIFGHFWAIFDPFLGFLSILGVFGHFYRFLTPFWGVPPLFGGFGPLFGGILDPFWGYPGNTLFLDLFWTPPDPIFRYFGIFGPYYANMGLSDMPFFDKSALFMKNPIFEDL